MLDADQYRLTHTLTKPAGRTVVLRYFLSMSAPPFRKLEMFCHPLQPIGPGQPPREFDFDDLQSFSGRLAVVGATLDQRHSPRHAPLRYRREFLILHLAFHFEVG